MSLSLINARFDSVGGVHRGSDAAAAPELRPPMLPQVAVRNQTPSWGWPEWFLLAQMLLPASLFLPGAQSIRLPLRIAPFALCVLPFVFSSNRSLRLPPHSATKWLMVCMAYLALMTIHPTTNSFLAGVAQTLLYTAILAPIFWVPAMVTHPMQLHRLLVIMLVFNTASSLVGIMQVRDPNRWMPPALSTVVTDSQIGIEGLMYEAADGTMVVRPPGLSDVPGAAGGAGMLALTLGVAFCFLQPTLLKKGLCLTSAFLGLAVIFLAHVRVLLLLGAGSIAIYTVVLILQNHVARVLALVKLGLVISVIGWSIAMSFGGQSVRDRFASLIEDDPLTVYDKSQRGTMLKGAFDTLIWEYPLGAGLGRWGMVRKYFGDESNVASPSIWAELQYPAWIIDGGVVLLVCYCVALIVTATEQLSIALNSESPRLRDIAAVVVALSAATIATTFGGVPFVTPQGMQFWFLAGALYGVWMRGPDQKRRLRPIAGAMS